MESEHMLVTQKELAECLRISSRQVRNLKTDGLFQEAMDGRKYDLSKCVAEYIDFKVKAETGRSAKISIEQVKTQHEEVRKQISIMKLRKLRRELHEAADVEAFLSDMLTRFKNTLLSLPSKMAMKIAGEKDINKIIRTIEEALYEALDELQDYDPDEIDRNPSGSVTGSDDYEDYEEDEEGEEGVVE